MRSGDLLDRIAAWESRRPIAGYSLGADSARLGVWHGEAAELSDELAGAPHGARKRFRQALRAAHAPLLARHHDAIAALAHNAGPETLEAAIVDAAPALVPSLEEYTADRARSLEHKIGFEYKVALLYSALLGATASGLRLIENARRETERATEELATLRRVGGLDLGSARITIDGVTALIEITCPATLNAEDDALLDALEIAVDLALLDDRVKLVVLRGGPVATKKYAGRRVFCSGINLTELYEGRLSYAYFVRRELGLVNKILRGLAATTERAEIEKPFIAVVDSHAIGGGMQLLLVMDYVIAEQGAWMSLPARKEGIIPGVANLRLPQFIGEHAARRAIYLDATIPADSPEGQALVDEVVPSERLGAAVANAIDQLTSSGVVSFAANRKALRIGREPLEIFREYMAHFAVAQADCHFSAELVANLTRHWMARKRL